jgi:two-component system, OmpR family, phosphate regulon response regulator PhoB
MNKFELQPPSHATAPERPVRAPPWPRPIVVVCEDEPALRELVRVSLGEDAYTFLEAADGDEALTLLRTYTADVLILDLMLPRRTGLEVLAELREEPRTAAVATVVLTAQPDYADRARELGADRVISKPFLPDDLAAAVREVLEAER